MVSFGERIVARIELIRGLMIYLEFRLQIYGCQIHGILLVGFQRALQQGPGLPGLPDHALFDRTLHSPKSHGIQAKREDDSGPSSISCLSRERQGEFFDNLHDYAMDPAV